MAGECYLVSCACGYETPVRLTASGSSWTCPQCGEENSAPASQALRRQTILAELAVAPSLLQFNLKSLFILTTIAGCYLAFVNIWGFWQVTCISVALTIYAAIQGLLLHCGTRLVVYGNTLAFIAVVLLLPIPCWLLRQREQARAIQCTDNLKELGFQSAERRIFFNDTRGDSQLIKKPRDDITKEREVSRD